MHSAGGHSGTSEALRTDMALGVALTVMYVPGGAKALIGQDWRGGGARTPSHLIVDSRN